MVKVSPYVPGGKRFKKISAGIIAQPGAENGLILNMLRPGQLSRLHLPNGRNASLQLRGYNITRHDMPPV